jgi:hypothetical protein
MALLHFPSPRTFIMAITRTFSIASTLALATAVAIPAIALNGTWTLMGTAVSGASINNASAQKTAQFPRMAMQGSRPNLVAQWGAKPARQAAIWKLASGHWDQDRTLDSPWITSSTCAKEEFSPDIDYGSNGSGAVVWEEHMKCTAPEGRHRVYVQDVAGGTARRIYTGALRGTYDATSPRVGVSGSGTTWVTFVQENRVMVKRELANGNYEDVGGPLDAGIGAQPDIAVPGDVAYVAYIDKTGNGAKMFVKKATSSTWASVGGRISGLGKRAHSPEITFGGQRDRPFVTWLEPDASTGYDQVHVARYSTQHGWTHLGDKTRGFSWSGTNRVAHAPTIDVVPVPNEPHQDFVYVAYTADTFSHYSASGNAGGNIYFMSCHTKYNGSCVSNPTYWGPTRNPQIEHRSGSGHPTGVAVAATRTKRFVAFSEYRATRTSRTDIFAKHWGP